MIRLLCSRNRRATLTTRRRRKPRRSLHRRRRNRFCSRSRLNLILSRLRARRNIDLLTVILIVRKDICSRETSLREDTRLRDAPRHTKPTRVDVDGAAENEIRLSTLREDTCKVVRRHIDLRPVLVNNFHGNTVVVDGNLHLDGRRILAVCNPLITGLVLREGEERATVETVANGLLTTLLAKPLGRILSCRLNQLLLEIKKEVVELCNIILLRGTILTLRIASLEGRHQRVINLTVVVCTLEESTRESETRKTKIHNLTRILDGD